MTELVDQPTNKTNRKVKAASIAAGVSAPLAYMISVVIVEHLTIWNTAAGISAMSALLELGITALITLIATHSAGYWTRERKE